MDDTTSLTESQVLHWLQQNPDFFANHPELLPAAIQASGKVLSLEAGQLNQLRRQNDQFREKLDIILDRIRHNEDIYRDFHAIQIRLIMATNPWGVIAVATQQVENLFNIERVTVSISAKETTLVQLFRPNSRTDSLKTNTADSAASTTPTSVTDRMEDRTFILQHDTLTRILGNNIAPIIRIGLEGIDRQLYFGEATQSIRSEALVPLLAPAQGDQQEHEHRIIGSLNLGGATPSRFLPSDATDLIQDLATIITLSLVRMTQK